MDTAYIIQGNNKLIFHLVLKVLINNGILAEWKYQSTFKTFCLQTHISWSLKRVYFKQKSFISVFFPPFSCSCPLPEHLNILYELKICLSTWLTNKNNLIVTLGEKKKHFQDYMYQNASWYKQETTTTTTATSDSSRLM